MKFIYIFIITMEKKKYNLKGVAHSDELTENLLTVVLLSSAELFSVFGLIHICINLYLKSAKFCC